MLTILIWIASALIFGYVFLALFSAYIHHMTFRYVVDYGHIQDSTHLDIIASKNVVVVFRGDPKDFYLILRDEILRIPFPNIHVGLIAKLIAISLKTQIQIRKRS